MLPKLQPGDKIAGSPYVIVDAIGKGGMGSVYKVRDTLLEIERAIKFIDVEVERGAKRDQAIAEVLKEGRVIAKLHHECPEHIVEVLSMGITADQRATPYLVMELVPGVTLSDFLKRRGGRLEAKYARQLAVEVLAALVVAHDKGIVHRDLKPANIMVQPIPGSETAARMKLIDFGITSEVGRRTIRRALTFRYGAPEQVHIEGQHVITAQTDLYALGVILFEAIAGRGPFDDICTTPEHFILAHLKHPAPSIATVVPWIPREHAQLIDSMLEKDPRKRPESARALGSKFSDLPWDFATSIPEDSQKTEENMNTALASVVQAVEDQKKARALQEQRSKAPPPTAPPPANPPGVSTTLPSQGVDPAERPIVVREHPVRQTVRMEPSQQSSAMHGARSAPTATTPPVPLAEANSPMSNPHVVARPFHVNNTAPLSPELDTRGKEPSTFRAAVIQALHGSPGQSPLVRIVVAMAIASVCALVLVEVGVVVSRKYRSPTAATSSASLQPTATAVAVPTTPAVNTNQPSPQAMTIATAAPSDIAPSAVIPPIAANHAPVASQSKPAAPRPSATSSARPDSADIMIDLGDGTKIPMHSQRKLPGSGL